MADRPVVVTKAAEKSECEEQRGVLTAKEEAQLYDLLTYSTRFQLVVTKSTVEEYCRHIISQRTSNENDKRWTEVDDNSASDYLHCFQSRGGNAASSENEWKMGPEILHKHGVEDKPSRVYAAAVIPLPNLLQDEAQGEAVLNVVMCACADGTVLPSLVLRGKHASVPQSLHGDCPDNWLIQTMGNESWDAQQFECWLEKLVLPAVTHARPAVTHAGPAVTHAGPVLLLMHLHPQLVTPAVIQRLIENQLFIYPLPPAGPADFPNPPFSLFSRLVDEFQTFVEKETSADKGRILSPMETLRLWVEHVTRKCSSNDVTNAFQQCGVTFSDQTALQESDTLSSREIVSSKEIDINVEVKDSENENIDKTCTAVRGRLQSKTIASLIQSGIVEDSASESEAEGLVLPYLARIAKRSEVGEDSLDLKMAMDSCTEDEEEQIPKAYTFQMRSGSSHMEDRSGAVKEMVSSTTSPVKTGNAGGDGIDGRKQTVESCVGQEKQTIGDHLLSSEAKPTEVGEDGLGLQLAMDSCTEDEEERIPNVDATVRMQLVPKPSLMEERSRALEEMVSSTASPRRPAVTPNPALKTHLMATSIATLKPSGITPENSVTHTDTTASVKHSGIVPDNSVTHTDETATTKHSGIVPDKSVTHTDETYKQHGIPSMDVFKQISTGLNRTEVDSRDNQKSDVVDLDETQEHAHVPLSENGVLLDNLKGVTHGDRTHIPTDNSGCHSNKELITCADGDDGEKSSVYSTADTENSCLNLTIDNSEITGDSSKSCTDVESESDIPIDINQDESKPVTNPEFETQSNISTPTQDTTSHKNIRIDMNSSPFKKTSDNTGPHALPEMGDNREEVLFVCAHCDKTYSSERALAMHVRIQHNNPLSKNRKDNVSSLHVKKLTQIKQSVDSDSDVFNTTYSDTEYEDIERCVSSIVDNICSESNEIDESDTAESIQLNASKKTDTRKTNRSKKEASSVQNKMERTPASKSTSKTIRRGKSVTRQCEQTTKRAGKKATADAAERLVCPLCDSDFATESGLYTHLRNIHQTHIAPYAYKCPVPHCTRGTNFLSIRAVEYHVLNHHHLSPTKMDKIKFEKSLHSEFENTFGLVLNKNKPTFVCPICEVRYSSETTLLNHLEKQHGTSVRPFTYTCPFKDCTKTMKPLFLSFGGVKKHVRTLHNVEGSTLDFRKFKQSLNPKFDTPTLSESPQNKRGHIIKERKTTQNLRFQTLTMEELAQQKIKIKDMARRDKIRAKRKLLLKAKTSKSRTKETEKSEVSKQFSPAKTRKHALLNVGRLEREYSRSLQVDTDLTTSKKESETEGIPHRSLRDKIKPTAHSTMSSSRRLIVSEGSLSCEDDADLRMALSLSLSMGGPLGNPAIRKENDTKHIQKEKDTIKATVCTRTLRDTIKPTAGGSMCSGRRLKLAMLPKRARPIVTSQSLSLKLSKTIKSKALGRKKSKRPPLRHLSRAALYGKYKNHVPASSQDESEPSTNQNSEDESETVTNLNNDEAQDGSESKASTPPECKMSLRDKIKPTYRGSMSAQRTLKLNVINRTASNSETTPTKSLSREITPSKISPESSKSDSDGHSAMKGDKSHLSPTGVSKKRAMQASYKLSPRASKTPDKTSFSEINIKKKSSDAALVVKTKSSPENDSKSTGHGHGRKLIECPHCDRGFRHQTILKAHIDLRHRHLGKLTSKKSAEKPGPKRLNFSVQKHGVGKKIKEKRLLRKLKGRKLQRNLAGKVVSDSQLFEELTDGETHKTDFTLLRFTKAYSKSKSKQTKYVSSNSKTVNSELHSKPEGRIIGTLTVASTTASEADLPSEIAGKRRRIPKKMDPDFIDPRLYGAFSTKTRKDSTDSQTTPSQLQRGSPGNRNSTSKTIARPLFDASQSADTSGESPSSADDTQSPDLAPNKADDFQLSSNFVPSLLSAYESSCNEKKPKTSGSHSKRKSRDQYKTKSRGRKESVDSPKITPSSKSKPGKRLSPNMIKTECISDPDTSPEDVSGSQSTLTTEMSNTSILSVKRISSLSKADKSLSPNTVSKLTALQTVACITPPKQIQLMRKNSSPQKQVKMFTPSKSHAPSEVTPQKIVTTPTGVHFKTPTPPKSVSPGKQVRMLTPSMDGRTTPKTLKILTPTRRSESIDGRTTPKTLKMLTPTRRSESTDGRITPKTLKVLTPRRQSDSTDGRASPKTLNVLTPTRRRESTDDRSTPKRLKVLTPSRRSAAEDEDSGDCVSGESLLYSQQWKDRKRAEAYTFEDSESTQRPFAALKGVFYNSQPSGGDTDTEKESKTEQKSQQRKVTCIKGGSFKCKCGARFNSVAKYRRHYRLHSKGKYSGSAPAPRPLTAVKGVFYNSQPPGDDTGARKDCQSKQQPPKKRKVTSIKGGSFKCKCGARFDSVAKYRRHYRLHSKGKQAYKCSLCTYTSLWHGNVGRHIKSIQGTCGQAVVLSVRIKSDQTSDTHSGTEQKTTTQINKSKQNVDKTVKAKSRNATISESMERIEPCDVEKSDVYVFESEHEGTSQSKSPNQSKPSSSRTNSNTAVKINKGKKDSNKTLVKNKSSLKRKESKGDNARNCESAQEETVPANVSNSGDLSKESVDLFSSFEDSAQEQSVTGSESKQDTVVQPLEEITDINMKWDLDQIKAVNKSKSSPIKSSGKSAGLESQVDRTDGNHVSHRRTKAQTNKAVSPAARHTKDGASKQEPDTGRKEQTERSTQKNRTSFGSEKTAKNNEAKKETEVTKSASYRTRRRTRELSPSHGINEESLRNTKELKSTNTAMKKKEAISESNKKNATEDSKTQISVRSSSKGNENGHRESEKTTSTDGHRESEKTTSTDGSGAEGVVVKTEIKQEVDADDMAAAAEGASSTGTGSSWSDGSSSAIELRSSHRRKSRSSPRFRQSDQSAFLPVRTSSRSKNAEDFWCTSCGYTFSREEHLKRHLKTSASCATTPALDGGYKPPCERKLTLSRDEPAGSRDEVVKDLRCESCGHVFSREEHLLRHQRYQASCGGDPNAAPDATEAYKCSGCEFVFGRKQHLLRHIQHGHGCHGASVLVVPKQEASSPAKKEARPKTGKRTCDECGHTFTREEHLWRHRRNTKCGLKSGTRSKDASVSSDTSDSHTGDALGARSQTSHSADMEPAEDSRQLGHSSVQHGSSNDDESKCGSYQDSNKHSEVDDQTTTEKHTRRSIRAKSADVQSHKDTSEEKTPRIATSKDKHEDAACVSVNQNPEGQGETDSGDGHLKAENNQHLDDNLEKIDSDLNAMIDESLLSDEQEEEISLLLDESDEAILLSDHVSPQTPQYGSGSCTEADQSASDDMSLRPRSGAKSSVCKSASGNQLTPETETTETDVSGSCEGEKEVTLAEKRNEEEKYRVEITGVEFAATRKHTSSKVKKTPNKNRSENTSDRKAESPPQEQETETFTSPQTRSMRLKSQEENRRTSPRDLKTRGKRKSSTDIESKKKKVRTEETKKDMYTCAGCGVAKATMLSMQMHVRHFGKCRGANIRRVSDKGLFKCAVCGCGYTKSQYLRLHKCKKTPQPDKSSPIFVTPSASPAEAMTSRPKRHAPKKFDPDFIPDKALQRLNAFLQRSQSPMDDKIKQEIVINTSTSNKTTPTSSKDKQNLSKSVRRTSTENTESFRRSKRHSLKGTELSPTLPGQREIKTETESVTSENSLTASKRSRRSSLESNKSSKKSPKNTSKSPAKDKPLSKKVAKSPCESPTKLNRNSSGRYIKSPRTSSKPSAAKQLSPKRGAKSPQTKSKSPLKGKTSPAKSPTKAARTSRLALKSSSKLLAKSKAIQRKKSGKLMEARVRISPLKRHLAVKVKEYTERKKSPKVSPKKSQKNPGKQMQGAKRKKRSLSIDSLNPSADAENARKKPRITEGDKKSNCAEKSPERKKLSFIENTRARQLKSIKDGNVTKKQPNLHVQCLHCKERTTPVTCTIRICSRCEVRPRNCHHLSAEEHCCYQCWNFVLKPENVGALQYQRWVAGWSKLSQCANPSVRLYLTDQHLPYWVQCIKCSKWRRAPQQYKLTYGLASSFVCTGKGQGGDACSVAELKEVAAAKQLGFLTSLYFPPYLKNHPAAPFLLNYAPDEVGMSVVDNPLVAMRARNERNILERNYPQSLCSIDLNAPQSADTSFESEFDSRDSAARGRKATPAVKILTPQVADCEEFLQPFVQPGHLVQAQALHPCHMLAEEVQHFPTYIRMPNLYLTVRNLVLALWCHFPKELLTASTCGRYVMCRGLVRVRCVELVVAIVPFLTVRGYINVGLFTGLPKRGILPQAYNKMSVVVVGGGIAGLAAARQLSNFGTKVTLLEAGKALGGRLCDARHKNVCVAEGAQTLYGNVNNPISIICHQRDIATKRLNSNCRLLTPTGNDVDDDVDARVDAHFNAMIDSIGKWRSANPAEEDTSLLTKLEELHEQFKADSLMEFTEADEGLLQFHLSNLEYACGCPLDQPSAFSWDQNEDYPQYLGEHLLIQDGYSSLIAKMADGLDVRLNTEVQEINYKNDKICVTARRQKTHKTVTFEADKVIVALPVSVLKRNMVTFTPALPEAKVKAIAGMGIGIMEKVVLEFAEDFWSERIDGADFFGCIPEEPQNRGLFNIFYCLPPKTLVTHLHGSGLDIVENMSDGAVVSLCCQRLQAVFSVKKRPVPAYSLVTKWRKKPHTGMAYSFLPVGTGGHLYDVMAQNVADKLFFAGEATNRQHPQSVTGAFESGLREAKHVALASYSQGAS